MEFGMVLLRRLESTHRVSHTTTSSPYSIVHKLIIEDPRNNSAWNQRWFASHRASRQPLDANQARKEADYAIEGAKLDPYNESPFSYLIGIVREHRTFAEEYQKKVNDLRQVLVDAGRDPNGCYHLTAARVEMLEMIASTESLNEAIELTKGLAEKYDVIRRKYWLLRITELDAALAASR